MPSIRGILHLVGGEEFVMSAKASDGVANIIRAANQSIQGLMINDGDFTVPMWSVVKIEWLTLKQFAERYPDKDS
ncbi:MULTISPECIES: hypothetical protein [Priestia]|uniref:hypothetical protein n=1 Tax=Priestia TaxID=2800373 RepID=UPI002108CE16|nr:MULTISPECIES: hypothetical protein [Priestia]MED4098392.1 hypothetical protein [Priestia megaterium]